MDQTGKEDCADFDIVSAKGAMQIKQREQESTTNNYEIQIQKNNLDWRTEY